MDGHQVIILVSVTGFILVISLTIVAMVIGRRDGRYMTERFSMLIAEISQQTKDMSRRTDIALEYLLEQSILNRQILERVDKH